MQSIKSLLVTILILGGAFLAYDYYLAPDADKIVFIKPVPQKLVTTVPAPPEPAPAAEAKPMEVVAVPPPAPPPSVPVMPATPPPPPVPVAESFVPPAIAGIEEATGHWTRIPATAFPRVVKVSRAVSFKGSFGAAQVPAGSEVTVMGAQGHVLTVAPNAQSPLRATVAMDVTDLKATLTQVYEAWRARRNP